MPMTRSLARPGLLLIGLSACTLVGAGGPAGTASDPPVDFAKEIAPLLAGRCVACHNAGRAKGGLDLSTQEKARAGGSGGPAIVPGRPDEGSVLEMVAPPD